MSLAIPKEDLRKEINGKIEHHEIHAEIIVFQVENQQGR